MFFLAVIASLKICGQGHLKERNVGWGVLLMSIPFVAL